MISFFKKNFVKSELKTASSIPNNFFFALSLQATWGVFDRENTLRRAMADTLHEAGHL